MASIIKVDTIQTAAGGTPTAADLGINTTGTVLQVVQGTGTTVTTVTSANAWTTTDASVTITPSSASSKIYIVHTAGGLSSTSNSDIGLRIQRSGTTIYEADRFMYSNTSTWVPLNWAIHYLDSPSTTSAITYTLDIDKSSSSGEIRHSDTSRWVFTAMEIAG